VNARREKRVSSPLPANWPKCPHPWHVNFKFKGKHHRLSLDKEFGRHIESKTDAKAEAERIRAEIRSGGFHEADASKLQPTNTPKPQRDVPMTPNLRALLEIRRHDPTGAEHRAEAYVFGNELGERVGRVKRAWGTACRRAGIVGLHCHDLRREAGSRMLEGGVPEHVVQRMLGHANLATTSRYLKTTRRVMHDAMQRYAGRQRCKIVAGEDQQQAPTPERLDRQPAFKSLQ
jgi:integrase